MIPTIWHSEKYKSIYRVKRPVAKTVKMLNFMLCLNKILWGFLEKTILYESTIVDI